MCNNFRRTPLHSVNMSRALHSRFYAFNILIQLCNGVMPCDVPDATLCCILGMAQLRITLMFEPSVMRDGRHILARVLKIVSKNVYNVWTGRMSIHMIYCSVVIDDFTFRPVSIQFISPCTYHRLFVPQAMPSTGTPGRSRVAVPSPLI